MHTFTLPLALLTTTLPAAGKKDIRYYLNGVMLEADGTVARTVATDGHVLLTAVAPGHAYRGPRVILPQEFVKRLVKLAGRADEFALEVTPRGEGKPPTLRATAGGASIEGFAIDGHFPDWTAVIPRGSYEFASSAVDPALIEQVTKAAKAYEKAGAKKVGVEMVSFGAEATLAVRLHAHVENAPVRVGGVVMPLRRYGAGEETSRVDPLAYCLPLREAPPVAAAA